MMKVPLVRTYMNNMKTVSLSRAFAVLMLVSFPFSGQAHDAAHSAGDTQQGHMAHTHDHMDHLVVALPNGLTIEYPMVLVAGPAARSVAAFMVMSNTSDSDDRLIAVEADFARSAQLHTHIMENDIAKMRDVEGGFEVAAGGRHELLRGGDHIMITGLKSVPVVGETVKLTLIFEKAGSFTVPFAVMQAGAAQHGHK